jgi:hypothetical protein
VISNNTPAGGGKIWKTFLPYFKLQTYSFCVGFWNREINSLLSYCKIEVFLIEIGWIIRILTLFIIFDQS